MNPTRIAVARARRYATKLETVSVNDTSRTVLVQIALLLPDVIKHIDAQASLLGHPANRKPLHSGEPTDMNRAEDVTAS